MVSTELHQCAFFSPTGWHGRRGGGRTKRMANSHPLPGGDRGPMHRCCVEPGSEGPLAPKRCLAGEAVLDRVHSVHVSCPRRGEEQWEWGRVWVRQPVPNAGRRGSYGCLGGRCGEIPRGPPAAVNLRENAIRRAVAVGDGQVGYRGGMGKDMHETGHIGGRFWRSRVFSKAATATAARHPQSHR